MKKLTRKFKEGFRSYDYNEQDIDILIALLDTVLEMMGIVSMEDHENIKKLSSFIQILSSGYSNTIIDALLIEEIYENTILPVLDEFDNRYSTKFMAITSKEIVNGIPRVAVVTDKALLELADDCHSNITNINETKRILGTILEANGNKLVDERINCSYYGNHNIKDINGYSVEEIIMVNDFIIDNRDTDDPDIQETIFNMIKDMSSILHNIYDIFTSSRAREHIEDYLHDLILIRSMMELTNKMDNMPVNLISEVIQSICYALIDEMNKNTILPPSSVILIESKFKALEDIKYSQYI